MEISGNLLTTGSAGDFMNILQPRDVQHAENQTQAIREIGAPERGIKRKVDVVQIEDETSTNRQNVQSTRNGEEKGEVVTPKPPEPQ
ncbi:unnamed protein product [Arabis nemorensis]|uniref:Uncharacterized protein n=1 Tax=Arabis nemorensis TaxID=586526 RepID=A0A565AP59_9BRAS|nr:unnamed protein product [Arabis nemorensis]